MRLDVVPADLKEFGEDESFVLVPFDGDAEGLDVADENPPDEYEVGDETGDEACPPVLSERDHGAADGPNQGDDEVPRERIRCCLERLLILGKVDDAEFGTHLHGSNRCLNTGEEDTVTQHLEELALRDLVHDLWIRHLLLFIVDEKINNHLSWRKMVDVRCEPYDVIHDKAVQEHDKHQGKQHPIVRKNRHAQRT